MRKIDIIAACVALIGAASFAAPPTASATYRPPPVLDEELWGYCCTAQNVRCCSRNGCEINDSGCVRL